MENGNPLHLLDVLNCHDVPFVIIGGHAVTCHRFVKPHGPDCIHYESGCGILDIKDRVL